MAVLFVLLHHGLSTERTSADVHLLFYVMARKILVSMRLDGSSGGRTARFGANKVGTCEVPCNTTFSIVNGLAMRAQLLFWRYAGKSNAQAGERGLTCRLDGLTDPDQRGRPGSAGDLGESC
jgi:hypothetical protein